MGRLLTLVVLAVAAVPAGGQTVDTLAVPKPVVDSAGSSQAPTVSAAAPRTLKAFRVSGTVPKVDGRLTEEAWHRAPVGGRFVQFEPHAGAEATERTEVRVLYDQKAIYVGVRLYDAHPDSIVGELGDRDEEVFSDWFYLQLDSNKDRRSAYVFGVNPRSVKWDGLIIEDGDLDATWDAVWDVATQVDSLGWTAEMRIPLSQLRFARPASRNVEQIWGLNFRRHIARREETSDWARIQPNSSRWVSAFGELRDLRGVYPPRRMELQPYAVTRLTHAPEDPANPLFQQNEVELTGGADLRTGLGSGITLTATINPDFAEIEADRSVVRLNSDYEPLFPEKRPFFLEGWENFRFDARGPQIFQSRRIGPTPSEGQLPSGTYYAVPRSTPVLGAVKLSGRTSNGWSIGALDAVSGVVKARIADTAGVIRLQPVEPLTNYGVGRLSRDFGDGNSSVGGIVTATHRRLEGPPTDVLMAAAYVGGLNFRHRFADSYELSGMGVGSYIRGSEAALRRLQRLTGHTFQRADADHLTYDSTRTTLAGYTTGLTLSRFSGGNWGWEAGAYARSPGFEVNDLGYQRDADIASQYLYLRYNRSQPGKLFRSWYVDFNQSSDWTFGEERLRTSGGLDGSFQFQNYSGGSWGLTRGLAGLDVRMLQGLYALATPPGTIGSLSLYSDRRRPVSGSVSGSLVRDDEGGGRTISVSSGLTLRSSNRLELSLTPSMTWYRNSGQFVTSRRVGSDTVMVVARLAQTTAVLTPRVRLAFSPTLSLQLYAQPFISAGEYSEYKEILDPHAKRFGDRFRAFAAREITYDQANQRYAVDRNGDGKTDLTIPKRDFGFKEMRGQSVLAWEYRPGSTMYLLWRQERTDVSADGTFQLGRDLGRLFDHTNEFPMPVTSVFLIKVSFWLGL